MFSENSANKKCSGYMESGFVLCKSMARGSDKKTPDRPTTYMYVKFDNE